MERIFNNSAGGALSSGLGYEEDTDYAAAVRALIMDAVDFNESTLMPDREEAERYYYGQEPRLTNVVEEYDSYSDVSEEEDEPNRSTIVSTDVRDTIMAILPSLMRIFASGEHVITYGANTPDQVEQAKQATDYIRYKLWNDNPGFLILHGTFKDALLKKMGIVSWDTKTINKVSEKDYGNISYEDVVGILGENELNQLVDYTPMREDGTMERATLRFVQSNPQLVIEGVPPDEFRVSRNTGSTLESAGLVGRERIIPASDLVAAGYDAELVYEYVGADYGYYEERYLRNKGESVFAAPLNNLVRYGEYYIKIDADGDGIDELRKICTIGDNYDIIDDNPCDQVKFAVFGADPKPHTLVGDSSADLTMDIQKINTNLIRGALDSLAQVINPRTGINETITNVDDALNDDIGAVIRTRGNPHEAIAFYQMPWVGMDVFTMKDQIDRLRISRTGVSEASKGLDPKALQSTAVMGVDLIASGAQERIELIARIFAETGLKDLYRGLLQEVSDWPNREEIIEIRGKFVPMNPSSFDASMRINVNPALGKGSDMTRLSALADIKATQELIISKFGVKNPVVTVEEYRNTLVDMLELVNIRDASRYFKEISPEMMQQIMSTPEEPAPEMVLAKAEYEKVKAGVLETQAEIEQKAEKVQMDDDFRRDELRVNTMLDLVGVLAEYQTADVPEDTMAVGDAMNQPG
jgi:hypothetical protein